MGKGTLEGTTLTCPWHGSQFNVTSGRLVRWVQEPAWMRAVAGLVPAFMRRNLPSYEVRVGGREIALAPCNTHPPGDGHLSAIAATDSAGSISLRWRRKNCFSAWPRIAFVAAAS